MARSKREVVQVSEENRNHKAAAVIGGDESTFPVWQKQKAAISECEASQKTFTWPKKGQFLKLMMRSLRFFQEMQDRNIKSITFFLWCIQWIYHFSKIQLSTADLTHIRFLSLWDCGKDADYIRAYMVISKSVSNHSAITVGTALT
jgi:hypothetical protein